MKPQSEVTKELEEETNILEMKLRTARSLVLPQTDLYFSQRNRMNLSRAIENFDSLRGITREMNTALVENEDVTVRGVGKETEERKMKSLNQISTQSQTEIFNNNGNNDVWHKLRERLKAEFMAQLEELEGSCETKYDPCGYI